MSCGIGNCAIISSSSSFMEEVPCSSSTGGAGYCNGNYLLPTTFNVGTQAGDSRDILEQPSCSNGYIPTTKVVIQMKSFKNWYCQCSSEEKTSILKELLACSGAEQILFLSTHIDARLSLVNSQDIFSVLPNMICLKILKYLDPVSLCHCSRVCKKWREAGGQSSLWRELCLSSNHCRLSSTTAEEKQLDNFKSPDGKTRWRDAFSDRYRLWKNWKQARCVVRTFEGHSEGVSCVQFDETRIVSGSSDNTIKFWDIKTNNRWPVLTLTGHSDTVRCLQLWGSRVASGSNDNTIKVWDLSNGVSWSGIACRVTMQGHSGFVRCLQMDGEKIISGSYDTILKVWDVQSGVCQHSLRDHDDAVLCLQYDTQKIVSGSKDRTIKIWDLKSGICGMTLHNAHADSVTTLQFDEHRIVSGSLDRTIKFWDVRTGRCSHTLDWSQEEGHTGVIRCLQADSWRVVSGSDDKVVKVWCLQTGKHLVNLTGHSDGVTCLRFNDYRVVTGSYDKTVRLWDFSC